MNPPYMYFVMGSPVLAASMVAEIFPAGAACAMAEGSAAAMPSISDPLSVLLRLT